MNLSLPGEHNPSGRAVSLRELGLFEQILATLAIWGEFPPAALR